MFQTRDRIFAGHLRLIVLLLNGIEIRRKQELMTAIAFSTPRPELLLLDINMPKMDGITVLKHIREDEELHRLPVIILTTSKAEEDRVKSCDIGANAYIVKPVGFDNFSTAV